MTYYVISLVITSNDIPLSPPIALAYHLVLDGSPFRYTKPHLSIVEKCTSRYPICWKALHPPSYLLGFTSALFPLPLLLYDYWAVGYTSLLWIKPPSRNQKDLVTERMACWTQQVRALWEVDVSIHSVSTHGSCRMIDPVTMREVWSLGVNDEALRDDSRIVGTWSALGPEGLGLGALNRMVCWETD